VPLLLLTACKNDDQTPEPCDYRTPLPETTQTGINPQNFGFIKKGSLQQYLL